MSVDYQNNAHENLKDNAILWNPSVAVNLSLIFSPILGTYYHMRNWETLGEKGLARQSRIWFSASIAIMATLALIYVFAPFSAAMRDAGSYVSLVLLLSWYSFIGRRQVKIVARRYEDTYQHQSWVKPILIGSSVLTFVVASRRILH